MDHSGRRYDGTKSPSLQCRGLADSVAPADLKPERVKKTVGYSEARLYRNSRRCSQYTGLVGSATPGVERISVLLKKGHRCILLCIILYLGIPRHSSTKRPKGTPRYLPVVFEQWGIVICALKQCARYVKNGRRGLDAGAEISMGRGCPCDWGFV